MLGAGKKTRAWADARRLLKRQFLDAGITTCELRFGGCWRDSALGFAHCRKRRHLKEGELYHVILACNPCHDRLEVMGAEEMHIRVHRVIDTRRRK